MAGDDLPEPERRQRRDDRVTARDIGCALGAREVMQQMRFESLPHRIFLDSSTLQVLEQHGGQIWEDEALAGDDSINRIPDGPQTVEALRRIFLVNERAPWEFAVSENSLREVAAKGNSRYLQWAYDVLDHWEVCLAASGPPSPCQGARKLGH